MRQTFFLQCTITSCSLKKNQFERNLFLIGWKINAINFINQVNCNTCLTADLDNTAVFKTKTQTTSFLWKLDIYYFFMNVFPFKVHSEPYDRIIPDNMSIPFSILSTGHTLMERRIKFLQPPHTDALKKENKLITDNEIPIYQRHESSEMTIINGRPVSQ